jgi:3-oxoacyl-[acyl-carrier protein] reductase
MSLQGKVALIAGGGRGIGAATSRLLASRSASVVVNYLKNAAAAEQMVSEIQLAGGQARAIQADIREQSQAERLVKETLESYGRLDILVDSTASPAIVKPFAQMTWDEFAQGVISELRSVFEITKAVLPTMQQQRSGRIIYVGSGQAKVPSMPGAVGIGTAKGALVSFSRHIAREFGPFGITANVVAPGMVETELSAFLPPEHRQRVTAMTPLGRIARPEDIARVIAFFASDDSGFMTGTYAPVNGGIAMD